MAIEPSIPQPKWTLFAHFRIAAVLCAVIVVAWLAALMWRRSVTYFQPEPYSAVSLPKESDEGGFVSSKACRACHPDEHASWHRSFHRSMTQVADEQSVQAPFDHIELSSSGRTYQLERRGGEFWVNLVDPDLELTHSVSGSDPQYIPNPPRVWLPVVMTTGSHHLQGYWVPSQKGLALHQLPFVFDLKDRRWVPIQEEFLRPPRDQRRFAVWNNNCIQCHSVAGRPGLNPRTDELWSSVAELGISCEACHGPGAKHVAHHANPVQRYQQHFTKTPDPTIVNPAHLDHRRSSDVCGQCHSSFAAHNGAEWLREGTHFRAGDRLEDSRYLYTFANAKLEEDGRLKEFLAQGFWPDGSQRVGGREYLAMTDSACFQRGELSCLSCHSMHHSDPDDQLAYDKRDNRACLPCHQNINDRLEQHTHHAPSSAGSSCYNCHMPHTSFALMKAIRGHRINSPRILQDASSTTARPNACNLCHLDQTLPWAQRWLHEWYGQTIEPLPEEASQQAASVRWLLKGDAVQRVVTAWHFGWKPAVEASGQDWPAVLLTQSLDDPYAVVRSVADRSLRSLLQTEKLDYDYIAPAEQRQKLQAVLLDQTSKRFAASQRSDGKKSRSVEQWRQLLLNSDGELLLDELRQLVRDRDNRDLELPE